MLATIDDILNRITMYRLVLYYLAALLGTAFVFSFFGVLPYRPEALIFSTIVILVVCWVTNFIFYKTFNAAANIESVYITALILALIITPVASDNYTGIGFIIFASAWAMASKYIFAIGKKHIFNPAAFGVAIAYLAINQSATWWVAGNLALLPFVLVGGLLVVRKLRRLDLVLAFALTSLAVIMATSTGDYFGSVLQTFIHSSFFFLAFAMLTEPLTMPPDRIRRIIYGAMVGVLFAPNFHIGTFYFTPELALLVGNLFAYLISPKGRFMLTLIERKHLGTGTGEFVFVPDRPLSFIPGQYAEWTLPHRFYDDRGNRRYFTIASSPTEDNVRLGVRFYEPASSFKRALLAILPGSTISISQLAGDFVLPKDKKLKLVFIAGGIGVTPFRSMVQYLVDTKQSRDIVVLYANRQVADISYKEIFERAQVELGIRTVYSITGEQSPEGMCGAIDIALITKEVPDYKERVFYISGPHGMVVAFQKTLLEMGVPSHNIKADFFPGFA